jgi:hypothetical protein
MAEHNDRRNTLRMFFSYLFFVGTLVAAIGWLAEWKHLEQLHSIFHHSALIATIGHGAQIIGALLSLITPDRTPEDEQ